MTKLTNIDGYTVDTYAEYTTLYAENEAVQRLPQLSEDAFNLSKPMIFCKDTRIADCFLGTVDQFEPLVGDCLKRIRLERLNKLLVELAAC